LASTGSALPGAVSCGLECACANGTAFPGDEGIEFGMRGAPACGAAISIAPLCSVSVRPVPSSSFMTAAFGDMSYVAAILR